MHEGTSGEARKGVCGHQGHDLGLGIFEETRVMHVARLPAFGDAPRHFGREIHLGRIHRPVTRFSLNILCELTSTCGLPSVQRKIEYLEGRFTCIHRPTMQFSLHY